MPITTIKGGVKAVSKVILYPNKFITPKLQITPNKTTASDNNMVLTDRKNNNKIIALKTNEPIKNNLISF